MHDLSAALLMGLEAWMLTATPGSVDMASYLDTAPDFQPAASALEAVQSRLYKDDVRILQDPLLKPYYTKEFAAMGTAPVFQSVAAAVKAVQ